MLFCLLESMSGSPPGSYGQLIPSHHNPVIVQDGMHASVPPVLPPHLLHVILNKDVVDHNDPSLLPEPNHVSLNHLYALSIKVHSRIMHMKHAALVQSFLLGECVLFCH